MARPITAVLLAGRIRPSPLREALGVPVLCLPVGSHGSLLDAWLEALQTIDHLQDVRVVVNSSAEVDAVRAMTQPARSITASSKPLQIIAEPAAWRGAGGILRDVTSDLNPDALVLLCEAARLPPQSPVALLQTYLQAEPIVTGAVGVCGCDEPAGVYAFSRQAIEHIPQIGYFDLKEQFLPHLCRANHTIVTTSLGQAIWRLHDLESYLSCVRQSLEPQAAGHRQLRLSSNASISPSAILEGCCVVESGAVIEDGAVLHDTVVLWGATVGRGAVVSRSVVGSLAVVQPKGRVVRAVVTGAAGVAKSFGASGGFSLTLAKHKPRHETFNVKLS